MAQTVRHGDVFELPLESGSRALCRIAYKSSYFRSVVLVAVHGISGTADPEVQSKGKPVALFYAGSASLRSGKWRFLKLTAARPEDASFSKRLVAGDVWIEDDYIGPPSAGDKSLPVMDVHGDDILTEKVEHVLKGEHGR